MPEIQRTIQPVAAVTLQRWTPLPVSRWKRVLSTLFRSPIPLVRQPAVTLHPSCYQDYTLALQAAGVDLTAYRVSTLPASAILGPLQCEHCGMLIPAINQS